MINENLIRAMAFLAGILVFLLILTVGGRHPPERLIRSVREFSGMLNSKSQVKNLKHSMNRFLEKNGACYHYGKKITPIKLMVVSVLLMAGLYVLCLQLSLALAFVGGALGAALPWLLIPILNRSDNEKMLTDIRMIYHVIAMQIRAGVYVTDALAECYTGVQNNRLRAALIDLSSDIVMKSDLFGSLEKFQGKFDNRYIDSLCITLLQAMESGQAVDLLGDIGEQVRDMEKAVLERRKGKLDRSITFYQLGMLSCILAVALYACIDYMMSAALSF